MYKIIGVHRYGISFVVLATGIRSHRDAMRFMRKHSTKHAVMGLTTVFPIPDLDLR